MEKILFSLILEGRLGEMNSLGYGIVKFSASPNGRSAITNQENDLHRGGLKLCS